MLRFWFKSCLTDAPLVTFFVHCLNLCGIVLFFHCSKLEQGTFLLLPMLNCDAFVSVSVSPVRVLLKPE